MRTNIILSVINMLLVLYFGVPAVITNTISVTNGIFLILNLFGVVINLFNIHELRVKNMIDEAKKELSEEIAKNKVVFQ